MNKEVTEVAQDIIISENQAKYDSEIKNILSNKEILARILKEVVSEFKDIELETIREQCIEGSPQVGKRPVHPGRTNSKIEGNSNESNIVNEGFVTFDIIFNSYIPGDEEPIKIIINIEAQNDFYPGYAIQTRGIYYGCRMISSQYGREFERSEYNKLCKVVTIWICTNPSKEKEESITEFSIKKNDVYNSIMLKEETYDLLDVIVINLSKDHERKSTYIIEMLNTLLTNKLDLGTKVKKLENDYNLPMTKEMERSVENMCNLSAGVYEEGREEGREKGKIETIVELYNDGSIKKEVAIKKLGISQSDFDKLIAQ